ncbi:Type 1 glutamine amidotransferase-like domain-containing protein [Lysinibacillus sphaericus]
MKKLILSGGGDEKQTRVIDEYFVSLLNSGLPLLYIPVAMDPPNDNFRECHEWINGVFKPLGVPCIEMWTDLNDKGIEDLRGFSAVYIGGGNTFHLWKKLKDTHFLELLEIFIAEGGVVYGGSAGAIILGSHLETCVLSDDNNTSLTDYSGLGSIGGYAILCHYEKGQEAFIKSLTIKWNNPVIALSEETGLAVSGKGLTVIGNKPAIISDENGFFEVDINKDIEWRE